jgi:hypothetical protein
MDAASTELPSRWRWVTDTQERAILEDELAREMPPQHLLNGKAVQLIARHEKRDDFLFWLGNSEVAQVHLTWSIETDPSFPHSQIFATFEQWVKTGGRMD